MQSCRGLASLKEPHPTAVRICRLYHSHSPLTSLYRNMNQCHVTRTMITWYFIPASCMYTLIPLHLAIPLTLSVQYILWCYKTKSKIVGSAALPVCVTLSLYNQWVHYHGVLDSYVIIRCTSRTVYWHEYILMKKVSQRCWMHVKLKVGILY